MESYVERPPIPELAEVVRTAAYVQRHLPTGRIEIRIPIGGRRQVCSAHAVSVDGYPGPGHSGTRSDPPALRGGGMMPVTGGLGMIGAHTARALVDLGQEAVR